MASVVEKQKEIKTKSSRIIGNVPEQTNDHEEHEVTAQISMPHDGGWGWVVVVCSFFSIFILDGVSYTIGSMLNEIAKDLKVNDSLIALANSTAVALYFIASPFASALINRFGFRQCAMSGSILCSFSLFSTYFTPTYSYFFFFYGILAGLGFALINMSSSLIVGFYFEKLRAIALAIASCGSSMGVMAMFPINSYLVKLGGWRPTILLHSGLLGIIFFLGMSYRPLLSLIVTKTDETEPTRTVIYLPNIANTAVRQSASRTTATATERLFSAVSNVNFPTAAAVVDSDVEIILETQPGPSKDINKSKSKLFFTAQAVEGLNQKQLKQVQSLVSKTSDRKVEINVKAPKVAHKSLLKRIFQWDPHSQQSRPLYRDDAFYEGNVAKLPEYQKSMMDTSKEGKTGLEYRMAVTRAVTLNDLQERHGFLTTAVRRVLATMMDPSLLRRSSFLLLCCSGFLTYLGFLVPYVYLKDRNLSAGVDPKHCNLFISAIGIANAFGRLVLGSVANKVDPLKLFSFWCTMAGISTIASNVSYNIYYQYSYCLIFGFSISSVACLRSVILVSLYGLDKLTNATGMILIFLGFGNLISTPLAGNIKNKFGYTLAFYVSGSFILLSGLVLIPAKIFALKEQKAIAENEIKSAKKKQPSKAEKTSIPTVPISS